MKVSHLEDCRIVGLVFFQLGLGWFSLCAVGKVSDTKAEWFFLRRVCYIGNEEGGIRNDLRAGSVSTRGKRCLIHNGRHSGILLSVILVYPYSFEETIIMLLDLQAAWISRSRRSSL